MKFQPYTVIVLVGPSGGGKSYFANNVLAPTLRRHLTDAGLDPNVRVVSSDECRRETLADPNAHKYDERMMHVSEKAFKLLHGRIDAALAWPYPAHFVVVDSTGLNEGFRKQVVEQARAHAYRAEVVVFDFKRREEYERHVPTHEIDRRILDKHLARMRGGLYRTLRPFDAIHRVRSKDFGLESIEVTDLADLAKAKLESTWTWDVVGDVHGCKEELLALLTAGGYSYHEDRLEPLTAPPGHGLILLGDLIDKGPDSRGVLELAYRMRKVPWFKVVLGNHENFVARYLLGEVKDPEEDVMAHFDCATRFKDDADFKRMLLELREAASPFYDGGRFVVTHAPCPTRYIGKLDAHSQRAQRGQFRRPRRSDGQSLKDYAKELEGSLHHVRSEAMANAPWHIFGHVASAEPARVKNKIAVDTGCVDGGALTMARIRPWGIPSPLRVSSTRPKGNELPTLWQTEPEDEVDMALLDRKEYGRVMWLARNKVNFISGTMAPADADVKNGVLESLDEALAYYHRSGVAEVVLQPKYMGSRCNVYLHEDPAKCYAVSRNGHVIRPDQVDLQPVFAGLRGRFAGLIANGATLVLDGELMPWRALGAGLIDEQFKVVGHGARSELSHLRALGFEECLRDTLVGIPASFSQMSNEEAMKAHGQARVGTWRNLLTWHMPPIDDLGAGLASYERQVTLHGADSPPDFKPFGILKTIDEGGTEVNWQADGMSNVGQFVKVSLDEPLVLDLAWDWTPARDYFARLADAGLEGVVVKPSIIRSDVAPALKVRNPDYLRIVYGYNYTLPVKYGKLLRSKRTRWKREASMREFRLGQKMLAVPLAEINGENDTFLRLAAAMVAEEERERALDPRL